MFRHISYLSNNLAKDIEGDASQAGTLKEDIQKSKVLYAFSFRAHYDF